MPTPQLDKDQKSEGTFTEGLARSLAREVDVKILGGDPDNQDHHYHDRHAIELMAIKYLIQAYQKGFVDGSDLTGRIGEESYQDRLHEARQEAITTTIERVEERIKSITQGMPDEVVPDLADDYDDYTNGFLMAKSQALATLKQELLAENGYKIVKE